MTVGFHSPLPPARTGVADYAAALLAGLRTRGQVEISPEKADIHLYHLGNNALHAEIYRRAIERPGIIVLHDAVLNHFLLGQLDESAYVDEFVWNYGEWHRSLARELYRSRAGSASDSRYFEFPMLRRIGERSRAVVVHNPAAAAALRKHAPHARIVEIPHLFAPPPLPSEADALRYRQRLGIGPGAFVFGVFGYLRESKRLLPVLEAFHQLRKEIAHATLLVAGSFVSSDLQRAAAPLLRHPAIVRLPFLPEPEFWLAARSIDACINLRYPAAGETSGIAIRLMGLGKPVLVTDTAEYARFPEDACIRIPAGVSEAESLRSHLSLLPSMTEVASAVGRRGAGHIQAHHCVETISRQYWDLLCEFRSG